MRFTFGLPLIAHPQNPEYLTADAISRLSRAAESAGFEAVSVTEHPIPHDDWLATGGHDALDPFVTLSFAAAATSSIGLQTNLTVVPYRNPAMLAKAVATLDRLSGGRIILGVGTGYLEKEFEAVGVDFAERNALFDESLEVMRLIWTGESVSYEGRHFRIDRCTAHPVPMQAHIPIWVGGNSALSRRRVAEKGDAWMPMLNPRSLGGRRRSAHIDNVAELHVMIGELRAHAASIGRADGIDIVFSPTAGGVLGTAAFDLSQYLDSIDELAAIGVTWCSGAVAGSSLTEIEHNLARFGAEVIAARR